MKARIVSTDQVVVIKAVDYPGYTKARVWEGVTENGVAFTAYIPVLQVLRTEDNVEFERDLTEHKSPSTNTITAINARFIL